MVDVDDMFTPGGFAVALAHGCELSVSVTSSTTPDVTLSEADLSCARCEGTIEVPSRKPARFLALNKVLLGGLCLDCAEDE